MKNEIIEIIAHELYRVLKLSARVTAGITEVEERVYLVDTCIKISISHVANDFISIISKKMEDGKIEESLYYAQAILMIQEFQDSDIKDIVLMAEDIIKSEAANIKKNKKNK